LDTTEVSFSEEQLLPVQITAINISIQLI